jgi:hypothetical protein
VVPDAVLCTSFGAKSPLRPVVGVGDVLKPVLSNPEGIRLEEKRSAIAAVEDLKRFVRALPSQSAVELLGELPSVLGVGNR